jgi:hypothetical protein
LTLSIVSEVGKLFQNVDAEIKKGDKSVPAVYAEIERDY